MVIAYMFLVILLSFLFARYHPACVGMTIEEAKRLDHFACSECSDDDTKRANNGFSASPEADMKVIIPVCSSYVVGLQC